MDDEYSHGRISMTISQILGTKRDKYTQLIFFVHERMSLIQLFNVFWGRRQVLEWYV